MAVDLSASSYRGMLGFIRTGLEDKKTRRPFGTKAGCGRIAVECLARRDLHLYQPNADERLSGMVPPYPPAPPVIGETAAPMSCASADPPAWITPDVFAFLEKITASVATPRMPSTMVTTPVAILSDTHLLLVGNRVHGWKVELATKVCDRRRVEQVLHLRRRHPKPVCRIG